MPYRYIDETVIAFNLDEITWCNQQAADMLGYPNPELLIGIEPFIIVSDEHYFDLLMEAKTVMTTGTPNSMMVSLVHRNEFNVPCLMRYAYSAEDGNFYAIVRPLLQNEEEKRLVRFLELVKNDIKTPETVIQGNTELIRRMKLNKQMLARSMSEIKLNIDEMRERSNSLIDGIGSRGRLISSQQ